MMARSRSLLVLGLCSALALACTSSDDDPAAGGGGTAAAQGGGATTGPGGMAAGGDGGSSSSAGGGGAIPGDDNPDGLPESASPLYDRDYETDAPDGITSTPNIALAEWGADFGHGPSGGWRLQPDPVVGPNVENEASAGWAWDLQGAFPVDAHHLITVSYMFKVSEPLLQEIAAAGAFWNHDQKAIDFKYHDPDAPFGEGNRNTIHFGESEGQVRFSHVDGGGGARIYFGPDWLALADEWVWLCHVIDMRSMNAGERYMATYLKREGDPGVTRIGIRYEDGDPVLQSYDGRGIWGFLSPFHGYWDDMIDRDGLTNDLSQMHLSVDQIRVMDGWPDGAHGPPF